MNLSVASFLSASFLLASLAACGGEGAPSDSACSISAAGTYPEQATSLYVLPYSVGESYLVGQGNCTGASHNASIKQQFAYDILMPMGTKIIASRSGQVVAIEQGFSDGTGVPGEETFIVVLHDDGTAGRYIHVTAQGALLELNEFVAQGSALALSGNSGNSTEPHLHFDVLDRACVPGELQTCNSIPVNFSNTTAHLNGLRQGEIYTAE